MRWFIYAVTVFSLINVIVIAYWRDNQVDLTTSYIVSILLLLPLSIIFMSYMAVFLVKNIKQRSTDKVDETATISNDINEGSLEDTDEMSSLNVYASTVQTSLGDDIHQVIKGLQSFKAADLDKELYDYKSNAILSHRVDIKHQEIKALSDSYPDFFVIGMSSRVQRQAVILQRLINGLESLLQHLAQGLRQATRWHTKPIMQHSLHPAWVGQIEVEQTADTEQLIDQMQRWPNQLLVYYFIPDDLDPDAYPLFSALINKELTEYGFDDSYIQLIETRVVDYSDYSYKLNLMLHNIASNNSYIYMMLGTDSLIDQDYIDQLPNLENLYEAAEFGYGLFLSDSKLDIPDIDSVINLSSRYKLTNYDDLKVIDEMSAMIEKIRKKYLIEPKNILAKSGILFMDVNSIKQSEKIENSAGYLSYLNLKSHQIIYAGGLLGESGHQNLGFTLALATGFIVEHEAKHHLIHSNDSNEASIWVASCG